MPSNIKGDISSSSASKKNQLRPFLVPGIFLTPHTSLTSPVDPLATDVGWNSGKPAAGR
ncbi:hypothetical protein [Streptomyces sp. yr375]|uniref:hypothetical protein n=1 Tax=Streptomyces sp. yr375 TaxID=1761906 RepID=UPI0015A662FF|nr:hypothetical protein [Streptomyces sp. yr375]